MLAPFDGVEVDALLDEFPEWTELSQEGDSFFNGFQNVVNLAGCGKAADAKPNTAVSALIAVPQSSKNVARLQRCRSASTSGGQSDVLESHQQRLALNIGKRHIDTARITSSCVTIQRGVLHAKQAVCEALRQSIDAVGVVLENFKVSHVLRGNQ